MAQSEEIASIRKNNFEATYEYTISPYWSIIYDVLAQSLHKIFFL